LTVASPCNRVCVLDRESGHCIGCGRTGAEIGAWPGMEDAARRRLLALLPGRIEALEARGLRQDLTPRLPPA
jgi:predicted Fe-S protein YdhL (DUF1289 family)